MTDTERIAELEATNTRQQEEVRHLRRQREIISARRDEADAENRTLRASLKSAKEANTPLRDGLRSAVDALRLLAVEVAFLSPDACAECGGPPWDAEHCRLCGRMRAALAVLGKPTPPEPAVTGTTSDNAPFRKHCLVHDEGLHLQTCTCASAPKAPTP